MPFQQSDTKVAAIEQHCIYMMATGKWPAGFKLPSIREAEKQWEVNRITVQKALKNLAGRGFLIRRDRSGYYVAEKGPARELARHRFELENLYETVEQTIRQETDFSPLAVFRYLARLAEIKQRERPECGFIECTYIQAQGHAEEIENRLGIPVMPLLLDDLNAGRASLPKEMRIVFTTMFHEEAVREELADSDVTVGVVAIEVSPDLLQKIDSADEPALLLETEEPMGSHIASDVSLLLDKQTMEVEVAPDICDRLQHLIQEQEARNKPRLVLLSPRHWGIIQEQWRALPFLYPVSFRIVETAWQSIASLIGLPLGAAATPGGDKSREQ